MPHSADEQQNQRLAIIAEVLYLLNLLLFPGIAFIILLFLYLRHKNQNKTKQLANCHLQQTFFASLWAGVMLLLIPGLVLSGMNFLPRGYETLSIWIVLILYFITAHASLVILGSLGLARAMAGKHYHYPFIGRSCSEFYSE